MINVPINSICHACYGKDNRAMISRTDCWLLNNFGSEMLVNFSLQLFGYFQSEDEIGQQEISIGEDINVFSSLARRRFGDASG